MKIFHAVAKFHVGADEIHGINFRWTYLTGLEKPLNAEEIESTTSEKNVYRFIHNEKLRKNITTAGIKHYFLCFATMIICINYFHNSN